MQIMRFGFWALPGHYVVFFLGNSFTLTVPQFIHMYTVISRKVVGKNVHATIPKGNMGYHQYTVPDDCSCRTYFCCFPLARANICPWPPRAIFSNFFEQQSTQNHLQYLSGLSRALFSTTFIEIAVNGYRRDASFLHLRFTWVPRFSPALSKQLSHRPLCWPLFCSYQYNWRQFLLYLQKSFKTDQR